MDGLGQINSPKSIVTRDYVEHYGVCSTAASTQAKVVTIPALTDLHEGERIIVKFANSQAYNGAPTLNVNGLGAKNIKRYGFTDASLNEWVAGEMLLLVYDGAYWVILDRGLKGDKWEEKGLGITGASAGQVVTVATVDSNGVPTSWTVSDVTYTLTVTAETQDGVTVTGQTVTVRSGGHSGEIYATAAYDGHPVTFSLPKGFTYYVSITANLEHHFNPTTASGIITNSDASVVLTYSDFHTIKLASDIKAALNADIDLTDLVGEAITCNNGAMSWDVVDYNDEVSDNRPEITLLHTYTLPSNMVFEPPQATGYYENGLAAGNYKFKWNATVCYFTLLNAIPAGGQLRATNSAFYTYASQSATTASETGTVSTTELENAIDLGSTGVELNHHDRINYGSNNLGESGLFAWITSDAPASTQMPRINKYSRPYSVNSPGFMAQVDSEFLSAIEETDWVCSANSVYEAPPELGGIATKGTTYTVRSKFCLASQKNIFGTYDGVDDGTTIFDLYVGAENADRIKYYNNSARYWWLRSPRPSHSYFVRGVLTSGALGSSGADGSGGVVLACKIKKSQNPDAVAS